MGLTSFELYRRQAFGSAMTASGVVEHLDVVEDIAAGQTPGWVDLAPDALALEQLKEALGHSVVMAVAAAAHAGDQVVALEEVLPLMAGELTALIGVQRDRRFGFAPPDGHQQRSQHQISVDATAHRPTNHLARVQVQHHSQVQPAFVRADVDDIGDPDLIGLADREHLSPSQ